MVAGEELDELAVVELADLFHSWMVKLETFDIGGDDDTLHREAFEGERARRSGLYLVYDTPTGKHKSEDLRKADTGRIFLSDIRQFVDHCHHFASTLAWVQRMRDIDVDDDTAITAPCKFCGAPTPRLPRTIPSRIRIAIVAMETLVSQE